MPHTATCACGQLKLVVTGLPRMHGVCHCSDCKRRTGSAFGISTYFPVLAVSRIEGDSKVHAFHHAAQAHDQRRHFCVQCGSTVFWYVSTLPELIGVAGGCFAEAPPNVPDYSVSHSKKLAWVTLPEHWQVSMS
jgi:hypothetical protein